MSKPEMTLADRFEVHGMWLKVEVTREDLDLGSARDCDLCPVARAVLRALRESGVRPYSVSVSYADIYLITYDAFGVRDRWHGMFQDTSIGARIRAFDYGGTVGPFSFGINFNKIERCFARGVAK